VVPVGTEDVGAGLPLLDFFAFLTLLLVPLDGLVVGPGDVAGFFAGEAAGFDDRMAEMGPVVPIGGSTEDVAGFLAGEAVGFDDRMEEMGPVVPLGWSNEAGVGLNRRAETREEEFSRALPTAHGRYDLREGDHCCRRRQGP